MTVKVTWYGTQATTAANKASVKGLFLGAEHILEQARRLAPIEEGTLEKDSVASVTASPMRAAVTFGVGASAPYACRQHEEMGWAHDADRQAKYLETPFNAEADTVREIIAREIKGELGA